MVKRLIAAVFIASPLFFQLVHAADDARADTSNCEKDAGSRQGNERNAFIDGCMKVKSDARNAASDARRKQANVDSCTKDAGGAQTTDRKAFVDGCLKAKEDAHQRNLQAKKPQSDADICTEQAINKNNEERKAYIDGCVKAKQTARVEAQRKQADVNSCSKEAGGRKGAELKSFVDGCLKGKSAAVTSAAIANQNEARKKSAQASEEAHVRKMKDPCYAKAFKNGEEQELLAKKCVYRQWRKTHKNRDEE